MSEFIFQMMICIGTAGVIYCNGILIHGEYRRWCFNKKIYTQDKTWKERCHRFLYSYWGNTPPGAVWVVALCADIWILYTWHHFML